MNTSAALFTACMPAFGRGGSLASVFYSQLIELVDEESHHVTRPFPDPFGDSCWRSSWTYASLYVLWALSRPDYDNIVDEEGISITHGRKFVQFFAANCSSEHGLSVFGSNQAFSRDQLVPLMYLLSCIKRFDDDETTIAAAASIVKNLRELESHGRSLSSESKGNIHKNLSFLINRLCAQFGIVYRWKDRPWYLSAGAVVAAKNAAENTTIWAKNVWRRAIGKPQIPYKETDATKLGDELYYKELRDSFALALSINAETAVFEGTGTFMDDLVDGFSIFNGLGALSHLCVFTGGVTGDVLSWRGKMKNMSEQGWGPAFDIVSGQSHSSGVEDSVKWRTAPDEDKDNDIIQSQRPAKFMNGDYPSYNLNGARSLDWLILKAFSVLWH